MPEPWDEAAAPDEAAADNDAPPPMEFAQASPPMEIGDAAKVTLNASQALARLNEVMNTNTLLERIQNTIKAQSDATGGKHIDDVLLDKYIKLMDSQLKACEIIRRWQESTAKLRDKSGRIVVNIGGAHYSVSATDADFEVFNGVVCHKRTRQTVEEHARQMELESRAKGGSEKLGTGCENCFLGGGECQGARLFQALGEDALKSMGITPKAVEAVKEAAENEEVNTPAGGE